MALFLTLREEGKADFAFSKGVMKSMAIDLYKQQSAMLHQWINRSSLEEKKRPGKTLQLLLLLYMKNINCCISLVIKFSILSGENGQAHMGHVTQKIAMKSNPNDKIDMKLVDEYMHCKVKNRKKSTERAR